MPTLFERPYYGASTHALIIGVGAYRHFENGRGPEMHDTMGLGQLTSPPKSALAFADWVSREMYNPDAPLGSIELLLSEAGDAYYQPPDTNLVRVDRATLPNIQAAFKRWLERCNKFPNSVALFFFSGHGITKGDLCLLPEDFGDSDLNPFCRAINFDRTYRGMTRCMAKTQCYFVDCCSQVPALATQHLDEVEAVSMITATVSGLQPRQALRLDAGQFRLRSYRAANSVYKSASPMPARRRSGENRRQVARYSGQTRSCRFADGCFGRHPTPDAKPWSKCRRLGQYFLPRTSWHPPRERDRRL